MVLESGTLGDNVQVALCRQNPADGKSNVRHDPIDHAARQSQRPEISRGKEGSTTTTTSACTMARGDNGCFLFM